MTTKSLDPRNSALDEKAVRKELKNDLTFLTEKLKKTASYLFPKMPQQGGVTDFQRLFFVEQVQLQ